MVLPQDGGWLAPTVPPRGANCFHLVIIVESVALKRCTTPGPELRYPGFIPHGFSRRLLGLFFFSFLLLLWEQHECSNKI